LRQWRKKLRYWSKSGRASQSDQSEESLEEKRSHTSVSPPKLTWEDYCKNGLDSYFEDFKEQDLGLKASYEVPLVSFAENFEGKGSSGFEFAKNFVGENQQEKNYLSCETGLSEAFEDLDFDLNSFNHGLEQGLLNLSDDWKKYLQ